MNRVGRLILVEGKGKAGGIRKVNHGEDILVTKDPKGQGSEGVEIVVGVIIIFHFVCE